MPALTIVFGVIGVILLAAGIVGKFAGRRPGASVGAIGAGVVLLLIGVASFMFSSAAETAAPEDASVTIKVSSTATAAAKGDEEAESAAETAELPVIEPTATPESVGAMEVFYEAFQPAANFDAFRLVEMTAYGPPGHGIEGDKNPFKVGQEIYIEFTVQSLWASPIELKRTFVSVQHPTGEEKDFGLVHEGVEVARYQKFKTGVIILLDEPGEWEIWPCYQMVQDDDTLRDSCTTRWQFFSIEVEE